MTPIGSTSSNIRRAIEFIVCSFCCRPGAPCGHCQSLGRLFTAKLIARNSGPLIRWWICPSRGHHEPHVCSGTNLCGPNLVESLDPPVVPVGELVVSLPAPCRDHRPDEEAAPADQVLAGTGIVLANLCRRQQVA